MKIWLNNLKEGDIFYCIYLDEVYKCKHLGDANNINFRMPRIKFEILNDESNSIRSILGDLFNSYPELFVNQYVYDNKEECIKAHIDKLNEDKEILYMKIQELEADIRTANKDIEKINKKLEEYENNR